MRLWPAGFGDIYTVVAAGVKHDTESLTASSRGTSVAWAWDQGVSLWKCIWATRRPVRRCKSSPSPPPPLVYCCKEFWSMGQDHGHHLRWCVQFQFSEVKSWFQFLCFLLFFLPASPPFASFPSFFSQGNSVLNPNARKPAKEHASTVS